MEIDLDTQPEVELEHFGIIILKLTRKTCSCSSILNYMKSLNIRKGNISHINENVSQHNLYLDECTVLENCYRKYLPRFTTSTTPLSNKYIRLFHEFLLQMYGFNTCHTTHYTRIPRKHYSFQIDLLPT